MRLASRRRFPTPAPRSLFSRWSGDGDTQSAGLTSNFGLSLSAASTAGILTRRSSRNLPKALKRKAIFLLYRVLQALASPVILLYLLVRGLRNPRYFLTLGERCGALSPSWQQTISASLWFHAVSAGEVLAAVPLIEEVRKRTPRTPVFVSTTTLAGRETAEKRLGGLADGVFFAPFDFVWCVRRVLRRLRPTVLVVLETEIWPNLFREAKRVGCGLTIVNGRISDRALPRYRRFAPVFTEVFGLCDQNSGAVGWRCSGASSPPAHRPRGSKWEAI